MTRQQLRDRQTTRRAEIEAAAYTLLLERGYKATSMLAVAKHAGASNETMYRWYGGKHDLFRAIVETNAAKVADLLDAAIEAPADPLVTLRMVGPALLRLVTSERAIALNRAAVIDVHESARLGTIIAQSGREEIFPRIGELVFAARDAGQLEVDDVAEAVESYLGLLIGDMQIRRVIGVLKAPDDAAIEKRAARAFSQFCRLYGARDRA